MHYCIATILQCLTDHEVKTPQPGPGGQDIVPSAAGQAGGGRGRRQTKMGQQDPVHADLCGVLCGTWKCLALPLSVSESWRRQVTLSCFTALNPYLTIFNSYLIISSPELLEEHKSILYIPICLYSINISFTGIKGIAIYYQMPLDR